MSTPAFRGVNLLVTGATGFIGSHLVKALVASGANVHVFARPSSSLESLGECTGSIGVHRGDVTDRVAVDACFSAANPEIVFHLAADLSSRHTDAGLDAAEKNFAVNLGGTMNVVRAAARLGMRLRKVVRTGSSGEYGDAATPFDEASRERPLSSYAASLVAATQFCQALGSQLDFDLVTARPALVYGPGQNQRFFIPQLIRSCLDGVDFEMTEGSQKRDFIYVEDVVAGLMVAASVDGVGGDVFNLATGQGHTLADVADLVVRLSGSSIQIRRGARSASKSDLPDNVSSPKRAAERLGWRAEVGLEEGLRRTIQFERER